MKSKKQCMADELEALLSNFDEWASKDPEWVFINAEVVSDLSGISLSELRGLSGRDILFLLEQLQSGDDPGKISTQEIIDSNRIIVERCLRLIR